MLIQAVRSSLARTICQKFRDQRGRIHVVTLSHSLEDRLHSAFSIGDARPLTQIERESLLSALRGEVSLLSQIGLTPILLAANPEMRAGIRSAVEKQIPRLVILSQTEITSDTEIVSRGEVELALRSPPEFLNSAPAT